MSRIGDAIYGNNHASATKNIMVSYLSFGDKFSAGRVNITSNICARLIIRNPASNQGSSQHSKANGDSDNTMFHINSPCYKISIESKLLEYWPNNGRPIARVKDSKLWIAIFEQIHKLIVKAVIVNIHQDHILIGRQDILNFAHEDIGIAVDPSRVYIGRNIGRKNITNFVPTKAQCFINHLIVPFNVRFLRNINDQKYHSFI